MYRVYCVELVLALITGTCFLPLQLSLTARLLNATLKLKLRPNLPVYAVLGAITGMMVAIAFIQFDMAGYKLPPLLVVPAVPAVFLTLELAVATLPLCLFIALLLIAEIFQLSC